MYKISHDIRYMTVVCKTPAPSPRQFASRICESVHMSVDVCIYYCTMYVCVKLYNIPPIFIGP